MVRGDILSTAQCRKKDIAYALLLYISHRKLKSTVGYGRERRVSYYRHNNASRRTPQNEPMLRRYSTYCRRGSVEVKRVQSVGDSSSYGFAAMRIVFTEAEEDATNWRVTRAS